MGKLSYFICLLKLFFFFCFVPCCVDCIACKYIYCRIKRVIKKTRNGVTDSVDPFRFVFDLFFKNRIIFSNLPPKQQCWISICCCWNFLKIKQWYFDFIFSLLLCLWTRRGWQVGVYLWVILFFFSLSQ